MISNNQSFVICDLAALSHAVRAKYLFMMQLCKVFKERKVSHMVCGESVIQQDLIVLLFFLLYSRNV